MGRHSGTVRRAFCRNGVMMAEALDGKSVDWLEQVSEEQYRR
jgi:hypothetical protein